MDVRQYFRKIREIEAALSDEEYPVVVSLETSDGGKSGIESEVSRLNAAKMIVEGRALLATEEQKNDYRQRQAAARLAAERLEMGRRVQVAIIEDPALTAQVSTRKSPSLSGQNK